MTAVVFHGTRSVSLILEHGFKPSTGGEFGPGVYFSENPDTAAFYAMHVARGAEPPTILIRKVDWIQKTQRRTPRTVQRDLVRQGYNGIIGIALNDYERQIVAFESASIGEAFVFSTVV